MIRGWTRYWNDIFKPAEPLDPGLVKALIATESGFDPSSKSKISSAKGLMQLLNSTINYLNDPEEMKNYLVGINRKNEQDPNMNICAGVRWLFRKKQLAEHHGKTTWYDAVHEYKGPGVDAEIGMKKLDEYYKN